MSISSHWCTCSFRNFRSCVGIMFGWHWFCLSWARLISNMRCLLGGKLLVEINRLNFEHYQIKFWRERNLVKGWANPGDQTRTTGNLRSWQGPKLCPEWARILCSHSYRKGLGSLSHYPGPAGLAGTLPEHPFSRWPVLSMVFPATKPSKLLCVIHVKSW